MRSFIDKWYSTVEPLCKKDKFIDLLPLVSKDHVKEPGSLVDMTHSDNLKEEFFNKKFNRLKTMGRLGKYHKYRNRFIDGRLVCEKRLVDLSSQRLDRIIARERNQPYTYYSALPLPINKVSKIVGVIKNKTRPLRYKPNYEPDYYVKKILEANSESYREFCNNTGGKVLPGAWRFSKINLVDMATPLSSSFSYDEMIAGLKSRAHLELKLPKVGYYDTTSILGLMVNPKANPGHNTSKIFGRMRKRSVGYTKKCGYDLAQAMINGKLVVDKSLVHIGGREKRNLFSFEGHKDAKARITCGQEDVPTLIGQSLVTPINKSLQMMNDGFNWGGRINGRRNFKVLVDKLNDSVDDNFTNVNTDFNGHDNNVDTKKIVLAFALLRCCYPEGEGIDNLFYYCLSGMVFKRLVLPESGLVYEISKGVLTGHAFTSIITTVCAFITLSTSVNKSCSKPVLDKTVLQGAGDDWIMTLPRDRLNFIHYNICLSGNRCDDLSENEGYIKNEYPNKFVTFLKKQYYLGLISWNVNELFTNFVYPTSTKMSLMNKIMNYQVMCVSGPFNPLINDCCKRLIIYAIIDKYTAGRSGYFRNIYYEEIFDRVLKALCTERNINNITRLIPDTMFYTFYRSLSGGTGEVKLRNMVRRILRTFDNKVNRSKAWMLRRTFYDRHESVRRLKVFDLNKVFIPAFFNFNYTSYAKTLRKLE